MNFFFFFFFLFENIVRSPQNQSWNTREKRELPRLQTKSTHSTARVKEQKKKKEKKEIFTSNISVLRTFQNTPNQTE